MSKQILNEEFQRMQKLAGIQLNENYDDGIDYDGIDYDDENFSDPEIDGYNDFSDEEFKESPEYHSYNDVLNMIKSLNDKDFKIIANFNKKLPTDMVDYFKVNFSEKSPVYREDYLDFIDDHPGNDETKKLYKSKWIELNPKQD